MSCKICLEAFLVDILKTCTTHACRYQYFLVFNTFDIIKLSAVAYYAREDDVACVKDWRQVNECNEERCNY